MGITVPITELSNDISLREDIDFIQGVRKINKFILSSKVTFFQLREAFTEKPRNGKDTKESSYSVRPTNFVYLTVHDIRDGYIDQSDMIYLNETAGNELEKSRLTDGEIIITRSGTVVGRSCIFRQDHDEQIYIPSGYLIIIKLDDKKINPQFAIEYLNSLLMKRFFNTYSCGKNIQNISQTNIKKIPFPNISLDEQNTILEEIKKINNKIDKIEKNIPNTQEVIEKTFCKCFNYISFEEYIKKLKKRFTGGFARIGDKKYLRAGARYNLFLDSYDGFILIAKKNYPVTKIGDLITVHKTKIFKKGYLKEKHILLEKEDVEPKTGIILNEEYVEKIDSDKVLFGDSDFLISKIDPFLGHVILNDTSKPYIGTTEFVPYKINRDKVDLYFIQYVLLSKNFLEISKNIMAGKRQPRISSYDLLNLKIHRPPLDEQKLAVNEIRGRIGDLKDMKMKVQKIKFEKDIAFMRYFNENQDMISLFT